MASARVRRIAEVALRKVAQELCEQRLKSEFRAAEERAETVRGRELEPKVQNDSEAVSFARRFGNADR